MWQKTNDMQIGRTRKWQVKIIKQGIGSTHCALRNRDSAVNMTAVGQ